MFEEITLSAALGLAAVVPLAGLSRVLINHYGGSK